MCQTSGLSASIAPFGQMSCRDANDLRTNLWMAYCRPSLKSTEIVYTFFNDCCQMESQNRDVHTTVPNAKR